MVSRMPRPGEERLEVLAQVHTTPPANLLRVQKSVAASYVVVTPSPVL